MIGKENPNRICAHSVSIVFSDLHSFILRNCAHPKFGIALIPKSCQSPFQKAIRQITKSILKNNKKCFFLIKGKCG